MSKFGWSLPPGCGLLPDEQDTLCYVCGREADYDCKCPECPGCGEIGEVTCFGREGHLPDLIADIHSLSRVIGVDPKGIEKFLFKGTACGVTFSYDHRGVTIGGYCEGDDGEIPPWVLRWPFTEIQFWDAVDGADRDGCERWDEVHGTGELKR